MASHGRPRRLSEPRRLAAGIFAGLALLATACETPWGAPQVPDEVVTPETIGIIATREQTNDGRFVTLEDGSTVLLPNRATDLTGPAAVGRLLIMGTGRPAAPDGGVWYAAVPSWQSGCFILSRANGEVRGDRMALSLGSACR